MKKKNLKKFKKYLKSKKGFSLLELVCAIMIMAIAVSATATGLNISNQSITKNSLMDKASAKAQMYCDVIMTYVEKTPSNDPINGWGTLDSTQQSANKLFAAPPNLNYMFTDDIQDNINLDVSALDNTFSAKQYNKNNIGSRTFNKNEVAYVIESAGSYTYTDTNNNDIDMVSYKITVYVDYGTNSTTTCSGIVTKTKYVQ